MGRVVLGVLVVLFLVFLLDSLSVQGPFVEDDGVSEASMARFSSYDELVEFLSRSPAGWYVDSGAYVTVTLSRAATVGVDAKAAEKEGASRYSDTNIQVAGVDEADLVKTDGSYIYFASDSRVYLIKAYPVDSAKVVNILDADGEVIGLFKRGDGLVVISLTRNLWFVREGSPEAGEKRLARPFLTPSLEIAVYDISDLQNPKKLQRIMVNGSYVSSRMIDDYVYVVAIQGIEYRGENPLLPRVAVDGKIIEIPASSIYYSPVEDNSGYFYTLVIAFDIRKASSQDPNVAAVLTGFSTDMYVSRGNVYLAVPRPAAGRVETIIYRLELDGVVIKPAASGAVKGGVLNQFSMDEYDGYFRIATTSNPWGGEAPSSSIYILDMNLSEVGRLSNIAPGERIYSVRFMRDKAFIVTFKQVDPLFVVDLRDPENPRILGELKIPGFSTYLHPFRDSYLIGLGRETTVNQDTGAVVVGGIKLSLFDVSDYTKPKELHKLVIGGWYVDSEALYNHKVFLLDSDNGLLVIPIQVQTALEADSGRAPEVLFGKIFQGVLILRITPEDGIEIVGNVTHAPPTATSAPEYVIKRALYIDDVLYTLSDRKMMMHSLTALEKLGELTLG